MKSVFAVVLGLSCVQLAFGDAHGIAHGIATDESSRELMLLAKPLRLPKVPPAQGVGADGLPELPKVQALVGSFLKEQTIVNTETKTFFGRSQMIQKEEMKKLERLKFAYDQKLKTQEKSSQALVKTNAGLARAVMAQNRANEQEKVLLKRLDERIKARRQQLQALEQRFLDGRQFMKSVLAKNDESNEMSLLETSKPKSFLSKPKAEDKSKLEMQQQQMAKETELFDQQEDTATVDTQGTQMSFIEVNSETQPASGSASQASLMEGLANLVNSQLKKTLKKTKTSRETKTSLRHKEVDVLPHTQEPVVDKAQEQASTPEPDDLDALTFSDDSAVEELAQVQPPLPKAEVQPAMPKAEVQPLMPKAEVQPTMPEAEVQPQMLQAQALPPTEEIHLPPLPGAQAQPPMLEAEEQLVMPDFSAVEELAQVETTPLPKAQVQLPMPKVQAEPPTQEVRPQRSEVQVEPPTLEARVQPPVPEAKPTEAEVMKAKEDADTAADDKFTNTLRDGLHAMRAAAKKGEQALRTKFQDSYMVGAVRQKALLQQQALLKSSLNSLKAKSGQLYHADAVLKERLAGLVHNLKQGGALLGGLAKVVTARVEDVPKTIQAQAAATADIVGSTAESIP